MKDSKTDWAHWEKVIQQAQLDLGAPFSKIFELGEKPGAAAKVVAADLVDEICRHYAEHRRWPANLDEHVKESVGRRIFFAGIVIKTVQSLGSKAGKALASGTENINPRAFLEWLLIRSWKAGGTKAMGEYLGAIFDSLDRAGIAERLGFGEPAAAASQESPHRNVIIKEHNGIKYPVPANEEARLRALREYDLSGKDSLHAYDGITFIASHVCGMPMALVTLLDREKQWFKSPLGIDAEQTPREFAFCNHTIIQDRPFIVPDSHQDTRFVGNPLVTGFPHVRFYAGAPLITPDGFALGSVCVADTKPRKINETQVRTLEALASQAMTQMEFRKVGKHLATEMSNVRMLQGLIPLCGHCKGVRDDHGYWVNVNNYLASHPEAVFSEGICKPCARKYHYGFTSETARHN